MSVTDLFDAARARGVRVCTAESCTGGMISAAITDVAGSSAIFDRSFITYTNAAKMEMLGVKPATLEAHGAVSEKVAAEMARGALAGSDAQIAVSVTGIAGPGGSEHKPEGRVCFGLATDAGVRTETIEFGAIGRAEVRQATTHHAIKLLLKATLQFSPIT
ncbi:CinA family protein [Yoonia litorea]|uniref:Nicotinamide-nucleotide amidase n=1 Tax=Yoonia litorea TaxID=1123755 RepID=A0A1I6M2S9_9RHOB|nr:CinA family protein [Yoonia litorea]SFS09963.1 nicotinamide-nucleotide amidase [Yoonia litorea]